MRPSVAGGALAMFTIVVAAATTRTAPGFAQNAAQPRPAGSQSKATLAASASNSAPALAESAAPSAPVRADDIVVLKNGGFIRGTILELAPGQFVSIQPAEGPSRRIDMSEVRFAGPASERPRAEAAPPPAPPPQPPPMLGMPLAKLTLNAKSPVTFYVRGSYAGSQTAVVDGYTRLCTAPCETSIPIGEYTFATSSEGSRPVAAQETIRVRADVTLSGEHESKHGTRSVGWATLVLGEAIGTVLVLYAATLEDSETCDFAFGSAGGGGCTRDDHNRGSYYAAGLLLVGIGLAVGLPLGLTKDQVVVRPMGTAPAAGPKSGSAGLQTALSGLSLSGSF